MKRLVVTLIVGCAFAGAASIASASHFGRMAFVNHHSPSTTAHVHVAD